MYLIDYQDNTVFRILAKSGDIDSVGKAKFLGHVEAGSYRVSSGSFHTQISSDTLTQNESILLPAASGTILLDSDFITNLGGNNNSNGDNINFPNYGQGNNMFISATYGYNAGKNSSSNSAVFIGWKSGEKASGNGLVGLGKWTLQESEGNDVTAIGDDSGRYNKGDRNTFLGEDSGNYSIGENNVGLGGGSLKYNEGNGNIAITSQASEIFREDILNKVSFIPSNISNQQISINSHGLGSDGEHILLKYSGLNGSLENNFVKQWKIIDSNTIELISDNSGFQVLDGTQSGDLIPQFKYNNTIVIGTNLVNDSIDIDGDNQIVLGNDDSSLIKTAAELNSLSNISISGGTGDFVSRDGSVGYTGSYQSGSNTITVKNGIITDVSPTP